MGRGVALAHIRRVALGTAAVPVLKRARPVQRIGVIDAIVRVELKPALTALCRRT